MGSIIGGIVFVVVALFIVDRMSGGTIKEWIKDKWNAR